MKIIKKTFYLIGCLLIVLDLFSQIVPSKIISAGGTFDDEGRAVDVDNNGNMYVAGTFQGTVFFDNDSTISLEDGGIFIVKYDPDGNLVWAKKAGGYYDVQLNDLVVSDSTVIITGYFSTTINFSSPFSIELNEIHTAINGNHDLYIAKYDLNGNFVWAKRGGGTGSTYSKSVSIHNENIYITGWFTGTSNFNTPSLFGINEISSFNSQVDIFVAKYNLNGEFQWARRAGGSSADIANDIAVCDSGVFITGLFRNTANFNTPSESGSNEITVDSENNQQMGDIFLAKYDLEGNFNWAKRAGGNGSMSSDEAYGISILGASIIISGIFIDTANFNTPSSYETNILISESTYGVNAFLANYDFQGGLIWAKRVGGNGNCEAQGVSISSNGIYITGIFCGLINFNNPSEYGNNILFPKSQGGCDNFLAKYDEFGNFKWAIAIQGTLGYNREKKAIKTKDNVIYLTDFYLDTANFSTLYTEFGHQIVSKGLHDMYLVRLKEAFVYGKTFLDLNQNCLNETNEPLLSNKIVNLNPLNISLQTYSNGFWSIDSLPAGNYTITIDTSNTNWTVTCPITQSFTVVHPDSLTIAPSFGMVANNPCPSPTVTVNMPFMRPCFTNQQIYVRACNEYDATGVLPDAFSIIELDPNLIFENASLSYTSLGNNQYRFEHGVLNPGQCVNYTISAQVACNAPLGLTLCLEANLYPVAACVLDTIPTPPTDEVTPCTLPWDQSSLRVDGWCANDSIYFTITNTGQLGGGDMECYSPVRVFVDAVPYLLDSIKLLGGETFTYVFAVNGATWRLEADQHPLHPGNSHPNAHVENCNPGNWTPELVNIFPQDDADLVKDIFCGIITGSYDPNDKRGFPLGLGDDFEILPNQDLEYIIRFQNTGTDTAFNVVVRDTLDLDFDIFSVTSGVASHAYSFRMYGPRVLEWTFPNILLPDSTTNEPLSNGFLSFKVKQKPNLPDGTLFTNEADIYFDFNEPIITNETSHKVLRRTFEPTNSVTSLGKTKSNLKLYPNPTKQEMTLSFSAYQKQVSYKLLNLSGQMILEKSNLYGKEVKVNLSEVPNGMYLMEVRTENGYEHIKIIKD